MDSKELQDKIKNNIFVLFEIDKLPEDKQEETVARIGKIIFQNVLLRILPLMEEEEVAEYNNLVEKEGTGPEELFQFFFDKVPDFLEIVNQEAEAFRIEAGKLMGKKVE